MILKNKKNLIINVLLCFCAFVFSCPASATAAQIFFGAHSQTVTLGSTFEVGVLLNTAGENLNAMEGNIVFPADLLTLRTIQDGNSIINLWLLRPQLIGNKVSFSGIIPGGYSGENGYLFSLIFTAKKTGEVQISSADERLLLNDGQGTAAKITAVALTFEIITAGQVQDFFQPKDQEPPEAFPPIITRNPELFNNQWFIVFSTQDKQSGIKQYEIKEEKRVGWLNMFGQSQWQIGQSPYLLQDQKLQSYIYIKAVDNAGNERLAVIAPANPLKWYEDYEIWGIIILAVFLTACLLLIFIKYKNGRDQNKKN